MKSAWIYEQSLASSSNFEQYFWQKLWKILKILKRIFQFSFIYYTVTQFSYDHIFTKKVTAISML